MRRGSGRAAPPFPPDGRSAAPRDSHALSPTRRGGCAQRRVRCVPRLLLGVLAYDAAKPPPVPGPCLSAEAVRVAFRRCIWRPCFAPGLRCCWPAPRPRCRCAPARLYAVRRHRAPSCAPRALRRHRWNPAPAPLRPAAHGPPQHHGAAAARTTGLCCGPVAHRHAAALRCTRAAPGGRVGAAPACFRAPIPAALASSVPLPLVVPAFGQSSM